MWRTNLHDLPEKVTLDKSVAGTAANRNFNDDTFLKIELRQYKYLNNIVEQDHLAVNRITDSMLGFKSFWSVLKLIAGMEAIQTVN